MAAATKNRFGERQPSEYVPYSVTSGYTVYKDTLIAKECEGAIIRPMAQGVSNLLFIGVADNYAVGASNGVINVFKTGEYTFAANGTGTSLHIGLKAYALDDQTVGVSIARPACYVGEIVGMPTTSTYRVRIDSAVGAIDILKEGLSFAAPINA